MTIMKNIYLYFYWVIASVILTACNRKKDVVPQQNPSVITSSLPTEIQNPRDIDQYFTESNWITRTEGPNSITRNIHQDKNGIIW